jgi:hypothetical protein
MVMAAKANGIMPANDEEGKGQWLEHVDTVFEEIVVRSMTDAGYKSTEES